MAKSVNVSGRMSVGRFEDEFEKSKNTNVWKVHIFYTRDLRKSIVFERRLFGESRTLLVGVPSQFTSSQSQRVLRTVALEFV